MPTTTELLNHTMRTASLNTSNTADSALALTWLNDAYQRALAITGSESAASETVVVANDSAVIEKDDYDPETTPGVATVKAVYLNQGTGSGTGQQLIRKSINDILRMRVTTLASSTDGPAFFAVRSNGNIELYPGAGSGNEFTVELELEPMQLVTSSAVEGVSELTPSMLPKFLHYEVLANFAISKALEYRGLETRASYFRAQANNGMQELREWLTDQGGIQGPDVKLVRNNSGYGRKPDQGW